MEVLVVLLPYSILIWLIYLIDKRVQQYLYGKNQRQFDQLNSQIDSTNKTIAKLELKINELSVKTGIKEAFK